MSTYKSDFLNVLASRGFIHQVSEPEALDALARSSTITAYIGFDCTARVASCRLAAADHAAVLAAADRPPADRTDGRRHHARRRSVRKGRKPPAAHRRGDQRKPQGHSRGLRQVPEIRRRAAATPSWPTTPTGSTRSTTSIFCVTSAGTSPINRMLAFDSVKLRLERQQELSFLEFNYMILQAYDFVELHRRARLRAADGRLRSVGQHRQRHRSRPPSAQRAALRADLAADHHVVGREDGQDRRRRGVAQRRPGEPVRVLAILAQHRGCRRRPVSQVVHGAATRRDRTSRGTQGRRRSTRRRKFSPPRRPPWCTAARRPTKRQPPRARPSKKADSARISADSRNGAQPIFENGLACWQAYRPMLHLVTSNGEARRLIEDGGLRGQRCDRHRRANDADPRKISRPKA